MDVAGLVHAVVTARDRCRGSWAGAVFGAALFVASGAAFACGLEDPSSIATRRGVLNLAFPESLHVGTAIWQAQLAGELPRDPVAQRDDLTPEARGMVRLMRAQWLLRKFTTMLPEASTAVVRPNFAVVLLGPVMWSRFETSGATMKSLLHVEGPERGDVIIVTDLAVIEAIAAGTLGFDGALSRGVMRLYGRAADMAAARTWFASGAGR